MTGYLWLRRNPLSLIFTAISPFSLLFILFIVSSGEYVQFAVAGSLVMALVGYGLALGQDISFYKIEYKMQDVFVASPVSSITYMLGLALSQLLYGLPALLVLLPCHIFFSFYDFSAFVVIECLSHLGDYVLHRIFFIFSYATYAKCHSTNIFRQCYYCSYTSCLLFNRKITCRITIHLIFGSYHPCIIDVTIFDGFLYSRRLVYLLRITCPVCILCFFYTGGKKKGTVERKLR